jgi:hypothetical protein
MKKILTTREFIKRARKRHVREDGTCLYDYSRVIYRGAQEKVEIVCAVDGHGAFTQAAGNHLSGQGCSKCKFEKLRQIRSSNTEDFIEKAKERHKSESGRPLYDYSEVIYRKANLKVQIICPKKNHGPFPQTPNSHLNGSGCPECKSERLRSYFSDCIEKFLNKAVVVHGNRYTYEKTVYVNARTKILVTCPIDDHGEFPVTPDAHLRSRSGCPKCRVARIFVTRATNLVGLGNRGITVLKRVRRPK